MDRHRKNQAMLEKRHLRIRKNVIGTPERPRLCVFRSNKHIYAQVVDDWSGHSLASASTLSPEVKAQGARTGTVEAAARVGDLIGRRCVESGITRVVFDRGGFKYHGRVKALAEAARKRFAEAKVEGF
jgi:large subunit ribosomal protein L18